MRVQNKHTVAGDILGAVNSTFSTVCAVATSSSKQNADFQSRPTRQPISKPPNTLIANKVSGTTFVNKIHQNKHSIESTHLASGTTNTAASSTLIEIKTSVSTSASAVADVTSAKMSSSILDIDAGDGNDSDDDGDFIMTRTAGKRRGNLSAADMLANEILDDINEDLNVATEDDEKSDPVKRLHRGYMNEAVAMVCIPFVFMFFQLQKRSSS